MPAFGGRLTRCRPAGRPCTGPVLSRSISRHRKLGVRPPGLSLASNSRSRPPPISRIGATPSSAPGKQRAVRQSAEADDESSCGMRTPRCRATRSTDPSACGEHTP